MNDDSGIHKTNHRKLKIILVILAVLVIISFFLNKISLTGFTVGSFEKDGVHTTFLDFPNDNKTIIFFLHGAGVDAISYYRSLKLLSENYHVIAPNIPIFGGASVPISAWDFIDFAEYFESFLEENKLNNIIAVGHSFGGGILVNLATISARIDYLILVDSAGGPLPYHYGIEDFLLKGAKSDLKYSFDKDVIKTFSALKDLISNIFVNSLSISHIGEILDSSLYSEYDYSQINIPVTILWGGVDDKSGFDEELANYFYENIPNSELVLVGGGHHWPLFEPERFYELIDAKIKQFNLFNQ